MKKAAYVAGWMYFVNWAMTGIVDITAVALYMHYWGAFGDVRSGSSPSARWLSSAP
ncbi:L-asparagine permease [Klebsiella pneumoniae]|uniref:L-asparagine permease n=1 Tax=Klebsiella pneumoniae TaxID=573 RepID=A0A377W383_KLEPN|nr:L-asparagine permease [Klebsiella pneumoniae]